MRYGLLYVRIPVVQAPHVYPISYAAKVMPSTPGTVAHPNTPVNSLLILQGFNLTRRSSKEMDSDKMYR